MRVVCLIAIVSSLGAVALAVWFFLGDTRAGSGSLVFAGIALTSGFSATIGPMGNWGMPGDEK